MCNVRAIRSVIVALMRNDVVRCYRTVILRVYRIMFSERRLVLFCFSFLLTRILLNRGLVAISTGRATFITVIVHTEERRRSCDLDRREMQKSREKKSKARISYLGDASRSTCLERKFERELFSKCESVIWIPYLSQSYLSMISFHSQTSPL